LDAIVLVVLMVAAGLLAYGDVLAGAVEGGASACLVGGINRGDTSCALLQLFVLGAAMAITMVVGVCFSRLYLGVHDLEDVLAGVAVGGLSLGLFRWTTSPRWDKWRNLYWLARVGVVLVLEVIVFTLWPGSLTSGILQTGGILIGWFTAAACERIYLDYQPSKTGWRRIASCLLGIGSLYLLFTVKQVLDHGDSSSVTSFIAGAFVGIHITLIMPAVFVLLRLADKNPNKTRT
jgi:undecaprenyl pyrophosphate phosphatase UppP